MSNSPLEQPLLSARPYFWPQKRGRINIGRRNWNQRPVQQEEVAAIATLLKTRPPHRTPQRRKKRKDVVFFALGSIWPRKHRPTSRTGFRVWPLRPARLRTSLATVSG